ncbi:MAG: NTP transferase domain-containing protein [Thermoflexales bacterium]|nr:NTP transferase domain-containing protein [Thermoflexales bacterium]
MQAVILAAGEGSRMNHPDGLPKVLVDLCGQTLLEHVLGALAALGIREFIIVVGYRGEEIEGWIRRHRLDRRWAIQVVHNPCWPEGNASSILAARPYLKDDRFVVAMGDHLFDPQALQGFLKVRGDFVGVFDSRPRLVDVAEATKARSHRGHVVALGKDLTEYRYVDTGLFICSRRIFPFIEECLAEGVGTFNEVKRRWIAQGYVLHIFDCQGAFWMDVDTPEDLARAREWMSRRLKKTRDGLVARWLNRRLSIPISRWLVRNTSLTPNQITVGVFGLTVLAALLFCWGGGLPVLLAGLLAQAASILDGCDGEVARLRHMSTPFGAWLDAVLDRWGDALLIIGMTWGAWRALAQPWVWPLGFLALTGSFLISYSEARYEGAFRELPLFGDGIPAKRDTRLFLMMLGGLSGQLALALFLILVLTVAEGVRRGIMAALRCGPHPHPPNPLPLSRHRERGRGRKGFAASGKAAHRNPLSLPLSPYGRGEGLGEG